jgi:large subunit ribosomal protein L17
MRHGRKINHLSRKSAHRKSMLQNMATSLILHKRIHTTLAKAKALQVYIEPLITKSKEDTTHSRRIIFSQLQSKEAVTELFRDISVKVADRPGGYTRIIKIGNRLGDNAELCIMELVDFNENLLGDKQAKAKPARKRRSTGKKKTEEAGSAGTASKTKEAEEPEQTEGSEAETEVKAEAEEAAADNTNENTKEESK